LDEVQVQQAQDLAEQQALSTLSEVSLKISAIVSLSMRFFQLFAFKNVFECTYELRSRLTGEVKHVVLGFIFVMSSPFAAFVL